MRDRVTPLLDPDQIQAKVRELGARIAQDYAGKDLVLVGLLNGVFPFFADLARAIPMEVDITFMQVSSYGGTESTGEVLVKKDVDRPLQGRHVLILEDIVDTGLTLTKVRNLLLDREPASLRICSLLDKPSRRIAQVPVDYIGFSIKDLFVVGYGLDFDGHFRNLPFIGVYQP